MNYLDRNNISSQKLRGYAADAISGLAIIKGNTPQDDYILLTDNSLIKNFDDAYINDMKALSMNNDIAKILDSYLNKK